MLTKSFETFAHPVTYRLGVYRGGARSWVFGECVYERRTKVPSLETCLASVNSPGNHAFSL